VPLGGEIALLLDRLDTGHHTIDSHDHSGTTTIRGVVYRTVRPQTVVTQVFETYDKAVVTLCFSQKTRTQEWLKQFGKKRHDRDAQR
jgi:hypothetical protein